MIGKLDQIVSIYNASKSISSAGEPVYVYTLHCKAFAAVESLENIENVEAESYVTLPRLKITIHMQSGISTAQRLVYNGQNFNITAIKEINRRFYELNAIKEEV